MICIKKYLNNPCTENECTYKRYKNKLTFLLRNAKKLYYERKIAYAKTNMKDTWKIEVVNGKKSSKKLPHFFKINGQDVSNPLEIANYFCDYFTNIGPNLANKITPSPRSHQSYLSGNFVNSIFFEAVTETEVIAIVNSLRPGTAASYDGIPTWSVNKFIGEISKPLTHINLSLQSGIVPDQLKIAPVIPLFKSGEDGLISNYRPISILPVFSKLFEKVVYKRLINYLDSNNILFNKQYGFRKNHSTLLALLDLVDKITSAIDEKKYTVGIFLDLSKAFDTVNHDILFDKLSFYSIRGLPLDWLINYF